MDKAKAPAEASRAIGAQRRGLQEERHAGARPMTQVSWGGGLSGYTHTHTHTTCQQLHQGLKEPQWQTELVSWPQEPTRTSTTQPSKGK